MTRQCRIIACYIVTFFFSIRDAAPAPGLPEHQRDQRIIHKDAARRRKRRGNERGIWRWMSIECVGPYGGQRETGSLWMNQYRLAIRAKPESAAIATAPMGTAAPASLVDEEVGELDTAALEVRAALVLRAVPEDGASLPVGTRNVTVELAG
ncbi:uncharacterized protein BJ171DRAFT_541477, partial [Polychytrium aggregatum]|uniref:uncharacterized protein n=1 Tax=Polychytrium aggregatum TaxID=110093 RepID=UPI0022FED0CB